MTNGVIDIFVGLVDPGSGRVPSSPDGTPAAVTVVAASVHDNTIGVTLLVS
ncbi:MULTISPECIES: hypothetical protein [unclassified Frankia]|uniref:hypothetical protein n=1 Tax=unclassified Frankia TaxID=2632575 RepID=UPI002025B557